MNKKHGVSINSEPTKTHEYFFIVQKESHIQSFYKPHEGPALRIKNPSLTAMELAYLIEEYVYSIHIKWRRYHPLFPILLDMLVDEGVLTEAQTTNFRKL